MGKGVFICCLLLQAFVGLQPAKLAARVALDYAASLRHCQEVQRNADHRIIAYSMNGAIDVSTQYEENEQIVNEIYLYLENNEIDTLNASQIAQLESIIYQCPVAGGNAVFRARALYYLYDDGVIYDDISSCNEVGFSWRQNLATINNQKTISIYPNPTDKSITIAYNPVYKGKEGFIYNTFGQLVSNFSLDAARQETNISVLELPSGVYYLKINSEINKFVIVR